MLQGLTFELYMVGFSCQLNTGPILTLLTVIKEHRQNYMEVCTDRSFWMQTHIILPILLPCHVIHGLVICVLFFDSSALFILIVFAYYCYIICQF